jgi:hypothetical protein
MATEAQINRSRGWDGESEDSRPGRPRSFAHNFGMHRVERPRGRDEIIPDWSQPVLFVERSVSPIAGVSPQGVFMYHEARGLCPPMVG